MIIPSINGDNFNPVGAALYVSEKVRRTNFARLYLYGENDPNFKIGSKYPYEELESRGWCRILGWTDPPSFVIPKKINPKLKTAIKDYCHNNGVNYPEEIKEKI